MASPEMLNTPCTGCGIQLTRRNTSCDQRRSSRNKCGSCYIEWRRIRRFINGLKPILEEIGPELIKEMIRR